MSEPLVIIGNGMAAAKLVEKLSARALGRYAVAVIGEEPQLAYNRVLLSSVLANDVAQGDVELKPKRWWRDRGVTVLYGHAATSVDRGIRRVKLASGATIPYSKLVFATGSRPIVLPIPGRDLAGVMTFRDLRDVEMLKQAGAKACNAVVIGGGLLGLEAAYGLAKAGAKVTVIHLMDRLMERQLDAEAAAMLKAQVEAKGIEVLLSAETAQFVGDRHVTRVDLKDGRSIPADIVVMAAGIAPNVALARTAGVSINRGIVVDAQMQTDISGIYAIGECAEYNGRCVGLVEPAYEQASVLADNLSGADAAYVGSIPATNLKVTGVNVFSAGDFLGAPGTEQIYLRDRGLGVYKKLVIANDKLVGAVLFGDTADGLWYLDLIRSGVSTDRFRNELAFGRALAERSNNLDMAA
ncbi:NAD(P)/FAD-dependent oxidoreductase [Pseudorhodoplanes sinuspersici]|uniref:Assimilatory nitrite reductase large subunit n=1 Tax=Pseudorhodoplanes sinuspersici TaxID=1235591 RepID=A0A1W6ZUZ8_9HYPH|nr:FAD-dependent oxidoreductase [Pseudorhodoplanes sinuspersici]ARQ00585.1 assimilatory nitrite reductase large subunit [Pseudorhodoplanes sinuspersici]RKE72181.1 assimilatory nitrate reductase (NADH) beta subunit [Pseudorhodoplanes sinuspersici]